MSNNARVDLADIRNRNVLHYAADAGATEVCEVILDKAVRLGCVADLINKQEKYLGAEQCFLVRGRQMRNHHPTQSFVQSYFKW